MKAKFLFLLLIVFPIMINCCKDFEDWEILEESENCESIKATGIIRDIPPEDDCGAFMIMVKTEIDAVYFYKPDNLPDKFKTDNLKVEFTYYFTENKHNCGFGGYVPVVKVLKIRKI